MKRKYLLARAFKSVNGTLVKNEEWRPFSNKKISKFKVLRMQQLSISNITHCISALLSIFWIKKRFTNQN